MKKTYEKPAIVKREIVHSVTAQDIKLTVSMIPVSDSYVIMTTG